MATVLLYIVVDFGAWFWVVISCIFWLGSALFHVYDYDGKRGRYVIMRHWGLIHLVYKWNFGI